MIQKLVKNEQGEYIWIECGLDSSKREKDPNGMTIDQLINRDGGILSHADGKIYQSKRSYLDSIKAKGCYIKE